MILNLVLLLACQNDRKTTDTALSYTDARESYPETTAALVLTPPDIMVPPYTDQQSCWTTTYTGPDVGVVDGIFRQSASYGHHVIVMRSNTDEDDIPDGTVFDCTESNDMTNTEPFILPSDVESVGLTYLELPEGMANKLKSGTRLMVQSHHINTTDTPILVNDRIELDTIPVDDVDTFVAPLAHTSTSFTIPPGEHRISVTCTFEEDHSFLYILGHLHEWGTSFSIDYNKNDGSTERIYSIEEWDVLYRDLPPITSFENGLSVKAGESFTTTCEWNNTTAETLSFPEEMCVTTGMIYPSTITMICDRDPD